MRKLAKFTVVISVLILCTTSAAAQSDPLTLSVTRDDAYGSTIRFSISRTVSKDGCSYNVYGSPRRKPLENYAHRTTSIATFDREWNPVKIKAEGLLPLIRNRNIRQRRARVYFRAFLYCGDSRIGSNIASIRVRRKRNLRGYLRVKKWIAKDIKYHMDYDMD